MMKARMYCDSVPLFTRNSFVHCDEITYRDISKETGRIELEVLVSFSSSETWKTLSVWRKQIGRT